MPVLFSDTKFVLICYSRHEDGCKSLPCEGVRITAAVSFSSVQFSRSVAQSCPTLCDSMNRNSQSSLKLTSIESMMPSSHLILSHPLLLLPPIPPSITVFSNESTLHMRWPKYWSFSFSIILSKEIPGLISFRKDCLDLLAVQGTLKSLLQHHSSKASIFWRSAFFTMSCSLQINENNKENECQGPPTLKKQKH